MLRHLIIKRHSSTTVKVGGLFGRGTPCVPAMPARCPRSQGDGSPRCLTAVVGRGTPCVPAGTALHKRRSSRGQSLIETLVGMVIIIPIGLASVDVTAMVIANHLNEHLADRAARAAANQIDAEQAKAMAQKIIDTYLITSPINEVDLDHITYDLNAEQVTVITSVSVNLPIPFGATNRVVLRSSSTQPIVATPAPM